MSCRCVDKQIMSLKGLYNMEASKMFLSTLREVPSEAEIPSHILLLRAGMIKKLVSGVYAFMPLGYRTLRKIENIVYPCSIALSSFS